MHREIQNLVRQCQGTSHIFTNTENMKSNKILPFLALSLCTATAMAQEVQDTLLTRELQEVVVKASKVIRKADMDIYNPSKSAVENSKNGMQLLNNLMIPSLTVSDALGSIQAAGQSVQVRINGRVSSIEQVRTLLPETIKRVEWIDNPGLRYGGANYVLNIIVTNPAVGGSLMANAPTGIEHRMGLLHGGRKVQHRTLAMGSRWQFQADKQDKDLP